MIYYAKAIDCVDHSKLWKFLEKGIPVYLTYLLRSLYAGQEATVWTRHETTTDWFKIVKEVCQGCTLLPCLFNFYEEFIMQKAGLDESKAGVKRAGWNIDNLRYAYVTTLLAESEEELKSLLMRVIEESEKAVLKLNIHKTKIMAFWYHHLIAHRKGKSGNIDVFYFLELQNHWEWWLQAWN